MNRQAWVFLGVMAAFGVVVLCGGLIVALLLGLDLSDDDSPSSTRRSGRCERPSNSKVAAISEGLEQGLSLRNAQAVKSGDYEEVWFIAADIQGPGLDGPSDIGVWASNSRSGAGLIFSADAVAREFSEWGLGPGFNLSDDGLREAQDCV